MPLPVLPDAIAIGREALLAQPTLTPLVSTRIYDRIPESGTYPLLVLNDIDDIELQPHTGQVRLQVDVWAAKAGSVSSQAEKAQARLIANTVRSVSRDLVGTYLAGDISNAAPESIIPAPDETTGRHRYVIDLILHTNP